MSRDDGFPIADVDTGLLDDAKVRALWRRLADQDVMCRAMTVYTAVLLSSWSAGRRVTVEESTPLWVSTVDDVVIELVAVGMLDAGHRLPKRAWDGWFGPAFDRREQAREAGRAGNRKRWSKDRESGTDRVAIGSRSPSVPSAPTEPSVTRARVREGDATLASAGDILRSYGLADEITRRKP